MTHIVYSRRYNIGFYGLERLHPFDSKKYERIWQSLSSEFGAAELRAISARPVAPLSAEDMKLVHSEKYLSGLNDPAVVAAALELPLLARLPSWLIDWHLLRPMRWAAAGTSVAAEACLSSGFTANLGGGFHHAKPNQGEGFSVYADAAIAIRKLRAQQLLGKSDSVAIIDTDAHQGNGSCHIFQRDDSVHIFDMYNADIYPCFDEKAKQRIDCDVPIPSGTSDTEYLGTLNDSLPRFLDSVHKPAIAIYNAGTDVFASDPLGGLNVSAGGILERDRYVAEQLRGRGIATLMLPSGGYTKESYELVSTSLIEIIRRELKDK